MNGVVMTPTRDVFREVCRRYSRTGFSHTNSRSRMTTHVDQGFSTNQKVQPQKLLTNQKTAGKNFLSLYSNSQDLVDCTGTWCWYSTPWLVLYTAA